MSKEKLELSHEERQLIQAYRKLNKEYDFSPQDVLSEVPKLQNTILQNWNGMERVSAHANEFHSVWLWHFLCHEILFGTPPNPALKKG